MRVVARKRLFFVNCGKRAAKGRQTDDKRTANERQKEERKRERERERERESSVLCYISRKADADGAHPFLF